MLNREKVLAAVDSLIAELDYDIWKYVRCSESDGSDSIEDYVDSFIQVYEAA